LPWNHTMGGNATFQGNLADGGTTYIDDGKPVPGLFEETLRNLHEVSPTYFANVPAGYAMLATALESERQSLGELPADTPKCGARGKQMARNARRTSSPKNDGNTANLGFEAKLWAAADALRNNMDAAEYKHVVLGLIFLKYISDAFEAKHAELDAQRSEGADPEDPDEYRAENIFWVPPEARWSYLKAAAPQPTIGQIVDDAMEAIERDNPSLKSVLPKDYARPGLDKQRLGQLINLVSDIGLGSPADRARDILGQVYIYFLSQFASAEGKKGGQFYTPTHVVRVLVEMLAPYKGRVYDPCCGSGGMFVQSEKFIEAHSGRIGDISIYGQESNYTTWRLAKMNLAIRGIDAQIAHGDSFHNDQHPDLKADYILANPPFNDSDWRGELLRNDKRWVYGAPSAGNANFAWVQHFIHHLAPTGTAAFLLANGSMSSNQSGEGEIRNAIVEANLREAALGYYGIPFNRAAHLTDPYLGVKYSQSSLNRCTIGLWSHIHLKDLVSIAVPAETYAPHAGESRKKIFGSLL
jgi:type I restriction enzyme M protein